MRKHALTILGGKTHPMQRNIERLAGAAGILKVLGGGAIGVLVLPIGHEQPLHREAGLLQQKRRDRRIDAAGHADDDGPGGAGIDGEGVHTPIIPARSAGKLSLTTSAFAASATLACWSARSRRKNSGNGAPRPDRSCRKSRPSDPPAGDTPAPCRRR